MKKNITINLCGRLFNIDEDAYELLRNYIDALRSYFAKQEGGDEIADDIEVRIAELLEELKSQGVEAVNINHVKQIVTRIGQPEEIASPNDEKVQNDSKFAPFENVADKLRGMRFYRNPKDKMIAGVVSGLASSFEVDVTLLRLIFVVVAIIMGAVPFPYVHGLSLSSFLFFLLIYAILAIIMPEAETPEQQLKMQGKPVNMQNLAEEIVQEVDDTVETLKQKGGVKNVLNGFLSFFIWCFKVISVLLSIVLFVFGIIFLIWSFIFIFSPTFISERSDLDPQFMLDNHMPLLLIYVISVPITLFIPAYSTVQHMIRPQKTWKRLLLLLLWMIALPTAISTGYMVSTYMHAHTEELNNQGFDARQEDKFLQERGWRILNAEGCNGRFTSYGQYYLANRSNNRYLDCYDDHHRQRYHAERTDTLMPGRYKLTCAARANGRGAFVYTLIDGKKQLIEIPATGNTGGSIWREAKNEIERKDSTGIEPSGFAQEIARANGGMGYGWNHLEFNPIIITKPFTAVSYGLTSDPHFTGQTWLGEWFSACDFIIERLDK